MTIYSWLDNKIPFLTANQQLPQALLADDHDQFELIYEVLYKLTDQSASHHKLYLRLIATFLNYRYLLLNVPSKADEWLKKYHSLTKKNEKQTDQHLPLVRKIKSYQRSNPSETIASDTVQYSSLLDDIKLLDQPGKCVAELKEIKETNETNETNENIFIKIKIWKEIFCRLNWLRLLIFVRCRRFCNEAKKITTGFFMNSMNWTAKYLPILNYAAWIAYVPRLLINIFLVIKHVFLPTIHEQKLTWQLRLSGQWHRRWFQLANDAVWCLIGLIQCFIVSLSPAINIFLTILLYLFDVVLICKKHQETISFKEKLLNHSKNNNDPLIKIIIAQFEHDVKVSRFSCWITLLLFISMLVFLPVPYIPTMVTVVGAGAAVLITIFQFIVERFYFSECKLNLNSDIAPQGTNPPSPKQETVPKRQVGKNFEIYPQLPDRFCKHHKPCFSTPSPPKQGPQATISNNEKSISKSCPTSPSPLPLRRKLGA